MKNNFIDYSKLFGDIDFRSSDPARSVYAPAAYLADLLQLLQDYFQKDDPDWQQTGFNVRRPDIWQIKLNKENTYDIIPYLDVVNELLEKEVGGNKPNEVLKSKRFPLNLPFNLDFVKAHYLLNEFKVSWDALYSAFHPNQPAFLSDPANDGSSMSRLTMGWSDEEFDSFLKEDTLGDLLKYFQVEAIEELKEIERYLSASGITEKELNELVYLNLSKRSGADSSKASDFWVNAELGGFMTIENDKNLKWTGSGEMPHQWFERANRFYKLARKSGLSFADLDLILRTFGGHPLTSGTLLMIPFVKRTSEITGLALDEVCAFFANLPTYGMGDEAQPQDLFNRTFNAKTSIIYPKYITVTEAVQAPQFAEKGYQPLAFSGDILANTSPSPNKDFLIHIASALNFKETDLETIVKKIREKVGAESDGANFMKETADLASLTLLFRLKKLTQIAELTVNELFSLFDLLEGDPDARQQNFLQLFLFPQVKSGAEYYKYRSCYQILLNNDRAESIWLLQTIYAWAKWMRDNEMSLSELQFLVTGAEKDAATEQKKQEKKIRFLNALLAQYKSAFLDDASFVSDRFGQRDAKLIYDIVVDKSRGVVSPKDKRLVMSDRPDEEQAAYEAIIDTEMVNKEDFHGLQIADKMAQKIIDNLILKGYVDYDLQIVEASFPTKAEDFSLDFDFSEISEAVFDIFTLLVEDAMADLTSENEEEALDLESEENLSAAVYPSDLQSLDLTPLEREALYGNLIFYQYIDEEGNIIDPLFFTDEENADAFELNIGLDVYAPKVYKNLTENINAWQKEPLVIQADIFSDTGLPPHDVQDLMENLVFNGYLSSSYLVLDKKALLEVSEKDFLLTLVFYPHRKKILAALKEQVSAIKEAYFALDNEVIAAVADEIVAERAFEALKDIYFPEGPVLLDEVGFFLDPQNQYSFNVDRYFDEVASGVVFDNIGSIIRSSNRFLFHDLLLEDLDFTPDEMKELRDYLLDSGWITSFNAVPKDQLAYFANINNALTFDVPNFEDYNKDIFFALHAIAKETIAGMDEIKARLKDIADTQSTTLFSLLEEEFGLSGDLISFSFKKIYGVEDNLAHSILLPVLKAVNSEGLIEKDITDRVFNLAWRRVNQLAALFTKMDLVPQAGKVVLSDQNLIEKFPEKLALPAGHDRFDALLETDQDTILMFIGSQYFTYSASKLTLLSGPESIAQLSSALQGMEKISAAYRDENGQQYIVAADKFLCYNAITQKWETKERKWGLVNTELGQTDTIDVTYVDDQGRTFIFSGNNYVRYSGSFDQMDEGYPKKIEGNWEQELKGTPIPAGVFKGKGSFLKGPDGKQYLLKKHQYATSADAYTTLADVNTFWGKVRNNLSQGQTVDTAYNDVSHFAVISGNQVFQYANSLEDRNILIDEGFPVVMDSLQPGLMEKLGNKVEAAFTDESGSLYLFGKEAYAKLGTDFKTLQEIGKIADKWGRNDNNIASTGLINAALDGLDGRLYLFSGQHYYRYSGSDYTYVDSGYPRLISEDWGGLDKVDASTILDGRTYLFGSKGDKTVTLRYSTRDYTKPDTDYSLETAENWWNLPFALVSAGFTTPDAVFQDINGNTHLFLADRFVTFDRLQRWWSEPKSLREQWDSLPFDKVDAAFRGKDGNTYLFSGNQYVRYSDPTYQKMDKGYPQATPSLFGKIKNNIAESNRVDAAVSLVREIKDKDKKTMLQRHTYLFAGDQYVRYAGTEYAFVELGYPKPIRENLLKEPGFENLKLDFDRPIDAVMADKRQVYVIQGKDLQVGSTQAYQQYENALPFAPGTALAERGRHFVWSEGRWFHLHHEEHAVITMKPAKPDVLQNLPASFDQKLESILQGADGNTYIFQNGNCYNTVLEKSYLIQDVWGKSRNNFLVNNTIDAGFLGVDGKLYIFSAEQYLQYTPTAVGNGIALPAIADNLPGAVSEKWGGLNHVHIAFVNEGKTYLMERPDDEGKFRYVMYSGKTYDKPDAGFPQSDDFSFWNIPDEFVNRGFDKVTAVHVEEDNFYLFKDNQFVQYNSTQQKWSQPMDADLVWPGLPIGKVNLNVAAFNNVKTLFTDQNGALYFVSDKSFVIYDKGVFSDIAPINQRWGNVKQSFLDNITSVDACFVSEEGKTFLFSGKNYIRYSTKDYSFVDTGYPKSIQDSLRKETGFEQLPDAFMDMVQSNGGINAIIPNGRHIIIFVGKTIHFISSKISNTLPVSALFRLRNNIQDNNLIDAGYVNPAPATGIILFSGDQYYRYSGKTLDVVDEGYPKRLKDHFSAETGILLPEGFETGIDAATVTPDGSIILVKGARFVKKAGMHTSMGTVSQLLGKAPNIFTEGEGTAGVDAAFLSPNGKFYAFKGNQYVRYHQSQDEFVEEGYPKAIKDNWGNMALDFEEGIDTAFVLDGKTYMGKGDRYICYSDSAYMRMDGIYPQTYRDRWGKWNDLHISDLAVIAQFKQLLQAAGAGGQKLLDFFDPESPGKEDPFKLLSDLFKWKEDEVKWIKRNNGFVQDSSRFEQPMNIEIVLRMVELFGLSKRLYYQPSDLYNKLWKPAFDTLLPRNFAPVAAALQAALVARADKKEVLALEQKFHDYFNEVRRNAMLPYVVWNDPSVNNARDLLGKLLIDVEMGTEAKTSRINEAISAVQLFLHRYFVQIESHTGQDVNEEAARAQLRKRWYWMKNYRVWEANRKVFLYPENYLRPELRKLRTPAFDTMVNELMQGEMNEDTISQIYKRYLDEYTEVSRLTIAGGYVHDGIESLDNKELILFGRTKADPRRYYYRRATFLKEGSSVRWEPWISIKINIESDRVYPVYAFGRIFVFWHKFEVEMVEPENGSVQIKAKDDNYAAQGSNRNSRSIIRIYFSFYNLNKEWTPPQLLDTKIVEEGGAAIKKDEIWLDVEKKVEVKDGNEYESIVVQCSYIHLQNLLYWEITPPAILPPKANKVVLFNFGSLRLILESKQTAKYQAYRLNPELYTDPLPNYGSYFNNAPSLFHTIFDASEPMSNKRFVQLSKPADFTTQPWFSFDHKGGSFLCHPIQQSLDGIKKPRPNDRLPKWNWPKIDAAFYNTVNDKRYFFSGDQFVIDPEGDSLMPISDHWGKIRNDTQLVHCAYYRDGLAWLYTEQGILGFSGAELPTVAKEFREMEHPIPIAMFYHPTARELYRFFVDGTYSVNDMPSTTATKDKFGKGRSKKITGTSASAFAYDGRQYLIVGDKYYRWRTDNFDAPEAGYPKSATLQNLMADIGLTSNESAILFTGGYIDSDGLGEFNGTGGTRMHRLYQITKTGSARNLKFVKEENTKFSAAFTLNGTKLRFRNGFVEIMKGTEVLQTETMPDIAITGILKDKNVFYVFKGDRYQALQNVGAESSQQFIERIRQINWSLALMSADWGTNIHMSPEHWPHASVTTFIPISSRIGDGSAVDAAWVKDGFTYMCSGDQYIRYSGSDYRFFDEGYPKSLANNTEGLPNWGRIDAAFTADNRKTYFFNNDRKIWVKSDGLTRSDQALNQWSSPVKADPLTKVDAAVCVVQNNQHKVYLFNGNWVYRHSVNSDGSVSPFMDANYPKTTGRTITAALVLDNQIYLFSGSEFKTFPMTEEFVDSDWNGFSPSATGLKNLHPDFNVFDAALNDLKNKEIHVYKNDTVITYTDDDTKITASKSGETGYMITRLTSGTGIELNKILFASGIGEFLSIRTQSMDETPAIVPFTTASTSKNIRLRSNAPVKNDDLPISSYLDFNSANGIYYWEMFYHAPLLIAQTYNNLQNFEAAKKWYEYVFDPTEIGEYWNFIPFLAVDAGAIRDAWETSIKQLEAVKASQTEALKASIGLSNPPKGIISVLEKIDQALERNDLSGIGESDYTAIKNSLGDIRAKIKAISKADAKTELVVEREKKQMEELTFLMERIEDEVRRRKEAYPAEVDAYLSDPFDAHAIARLRKLAYRKSVVMRYVDNLLDWGDMLFRQYTVESINEARAHYILAYDLLGPKPENIGSLLLPVEKAYEDLDNVSLGAYDFNLKTLDKREPYFYIPENDNFLEYWNRVEDRLYKIRQSLNILGQKQALPLWQPPLDPMALVGAMAGGSSLEGLSAASLAPVPHYRFSFMVEQAKQLAEKLNSFSNDLLQQLEKRDSEELYLLQSQQEGEILDLTIKINQAQIEEATWNVASMREMLAEATARKKHYERLLNEGLLSLEEAQIGLMITTNVLYAVSGALKIGSALAFAFPKLDIGPFKFGIQVGGDMVANALDRIADSIQGIAQVTSTTGEIIGLYANHERMKQDWRLQLAIAENNARQFEYQVKAAEAQKAMAEQQMRILDRQIDHNKKVSDFYRSKYTNRELYSWMVSQLSTLYNQTYKQAFELAKSAEKAYQFERGVKESEVNFIGGGHWDTQRKGLLAGYRLGAELQQMENAYHQTNQRSLEIQKEVSLFALDPMALVNLKQNRLCEFSLTEALYNYDFQGHYRRQIKTLSVSFIAGDKYLTGVNGTLTQLTHQTVMEADIKAVKYLLQPKGDIPTSIRGNWRGGQQIALSKGSEDSGLFEQQFYDERYLPFEGTGAVSDWRLELSGRREMFDTQAITDVVITVMYTAEQGGALFASEVKNTLKPYTAAQIIDVAAQQPEAWDEFLNSEGNDLQIGLSLDMFPRIKGNRIEGILCKYLLYEPGEIKMMLKEQDGRELPDGKLLETSGLKLPKEGSIWTFTLDGDKENLQNVELIFVYTADLG